MKKFVKRSRFNKIKMNKFISNLIKIKKKFIYMEPLQKETHYYNIIILRRKKFLLLQREVLKNGVNIL